MNELETARKNELLKAMSATELAPLEVKNEISVQTYSKIPLSRLTALGTGFEPVVSAIQQVTSHGQATSGFYKVTIPKGTHLAQFKEKSGFLGTAVGEHGIVGQAQLNPLLCDPTTLLAAATLANIDKKLDAIQEVQQEMLDFLAQKEKSALKADLNFLMDIQNNYKYNWNSEKYKAANHAKVLDIRQEAARQIDFYQEQIKKQLGKKALLHSDHDVQKMLEKVQGEFKEYQLALYIYGFAYFLEVVLQENYEKAYLSAIAKRIDEMAFQYREFYSLAYSQIENLSKSSLQAHLFGGLSAINKGAGTAIAKIPGINKSQIDETLIEAGERIGAYKNRRVQTTMQQLLERQSSCVRPFIDNINAVNRLYNEPVTLIFNHDTLYLGSTPDQT
ncbi:hypothetical protein DW923_12065 [Butyricicoccus sp. AM42-5AC]|jgi:hypothetical protein|uniref:hypothetical protein n=1 Tax=Agathobaculum sp. TaxID=2048138 RepID=UPI000E46FE3F|nr:hypothetical protein DW923_12065 [Butyricicoccus sp. AM42-5AC]